MCNLIDVTFTSSGHHVLFTYDIVLTDPKAVYTCVYHTTP